ncbi:hypothetical protein LCGC14_2382050, partial [marine sediment metagenome]
MSRRNFLPILILFVIGYSQLCTGQNNVKISVEPSDNAPIISKHIYGHFAEHLGRCIYEGFYVGDSSAIPNSAGVRLDIIDALKELQIPNLRWPGGCFADT